MRRRVAVAGALAALGLLLSSCASAAVAGDRPAPRPSASTAVPAGVVPDCEKMISSSLADSFTALGWTFREHEFRIGDQTIPGGRECVWGDYRGPGGDNVQIFGWAYLPDAQARTLQAALEKAGWIRSEKPDRVYLSEDPQYSLRKDTDGFGMTYLFEKGMVTLADTRQSLLLIER